MVSSPAGVELIGQSLSAFIQRQPLLLGALTLMLLFGKLSSAGLSCFLSQLMTNSFLEL